VFQIAPVPTARTASRSSTRSPRSVESAAGIPARRQSLSSGSPSAPNVERRCRDGPSLSELRRRRPGPRRGRGRGLRRVPRVRPPRDEMTNSDAGPNAESDSVTYRECYRRMKRDHGRLGGLFLGWFCSRALSTTLRCGARAASNPVSRRAVADRLYLARWRSGKVGFWNTPNKTKVSANCSTNWE